MVNFKYDNAPTYYYGDGSGYNNVIPSEVAISELNDPLNHENWNCQDRSFFNTFGIIPGYKSSIMFSGGNAGINCSDYDGGDDNIIKFTKYINDPHWDPLITKISTKGYTDDNVQKVINCCSNSLTSTADKESCGSLYYDGTGDKPPQCASLLKKWCKDDKNMNDDKCYDTVSSDPNYFNLKSVCAKKKPGDGWDNICACHYPTKFYTDIATEIADVWHAPFNLIETKPECIYPQCKVSGTRDKRAKCSPTSFTQCIQETNVDLSNSNVRDVKIDQSKLQCGQYSKKKTWRIRWFIKW
jgi:hypothetical protein